MTTTPPAPPDPLRPRVLAARHYDYEAVPEGEAPPEPDPDPAVVAAVAARAAESRAARLARRTAHGARDASGRYCRADAVEWGRLTNAQAARRIVNLIKTGRGHELLRERGPGGVDPDDDGDEVAPDRPVPPAPTPKPPPDRGREYDAPADPPPRNPLPCPRGCGRTVHKGGCRGLRTPARAAAADARPVRRVEARGGAP